MSLTGLNSSFEGWFGLEERLPGIIPPNPAGFKGVAKSPQRLSGLSMEKAPALPSRAGTVGLSPSVVLGWFWGVERSFNSDSVPEEAWRPFGRLCRKLGGCLDKMILKMVKNEKFGLIFKYHAYAWRSET